jgi:thiol-disulfide isomerase/thioredoxin
MYPSALLVALAVLLPPVSREAAGWQANYETAQNLVRESRKPLAVFVGSGSAGWNQLLQEGELSKEAGRILATDYVCLYVDVNQTGGKRLAAAFGVTDGPGLIISDASGELQAFRHEGKLAQDALLRHLRKYSDRQRMVRVTEGTPVGPREETALAARQGEGSQPADPTTGTADASDTMLTELSCQEWINSKPLKLEGLRGKVVLLDFWATWCGHCVAELPEVQQAHDLFHDQGLVVIGIHHNSVPADQVRAFVQNRGLSYAIALDNAEGATCVNYNVTRFPTMILIDRQGRIVPGAHRGPELLESVRRAVLLGRDRK